MLGEACRRPGPTRWLPQLHQPAGRAESHRRPWPGFLRNRAAGRKSFAEHSEAQYKETRLRSIDAGFVKPPKETSAALGGGQGTKRGAMAGGTGTGNKV